MFYMIKRNICSFNKSIKKINITASWVFVCKDSIKKYRLEYQFEQSFYVKGN